MPKVKFGAFIPTFISANYPPDIRELAGFSKRAEELGFDSLWINEVPYVRVLGASLEPFAILGYAAATTSRVKLGTAVIVAPLKSPVLLARSAATLDYISNGRLILGLGVGHFRGDFETYDVNFAERGARTEESIKIMKKLWTGEKIDFQGRFFTYKGVAIVPKPVQKPHPPIWLGAESNKSLDRIARLGDGWVASAFSAPPEEIGRKWSSVTRKARTLGRDPRNLEAATVVYAHMASNAKRALREAAPYVSERHGGRPPENLATRSILGSKEECIESLQKRIDSGISHFLLLFVKDVAAQIERFAERVLPEFR